MTKTLLQFYRCYALALASLAALGAISADAQQADSPAILLERALYLEAVEGDLEKASAMYVDILSDQRTGARTRAEASLLAAECFDDFDELLLAKYYYEMTIHTFPGAERLVSRAKDGLHDLTSYIMEDSGGLSGTNFLWIGDLLIALEGALAHSETDRAKQILIDLTSILKVAGKDLDGFEEARVVNSLLEVTRTLGTHVSEGQLSQAASLVAADPNVRVFKERSHFADTDEVFSPALSSMDKIAKALNGEKNPTQISARCKSVIDYLRPLTQLSDSSAEERSFAAQISTANESIRKNVEQNEWPRARAVWLKFRRDSFESNAPHFHLGDLISSQLGDETYFPRFALVLDQLTLASEASEAGDGEAVEKAFSQALEVLAELEKLSSGTYDEDIVLTYQATFQEMSKAYETGGLAKVRPLLEAETTDTDHDADE